MPFNISYDSVGLLGQLAQQAGQSRGQQQGFEEGMQLSDLSLKQQQLQMQQQAQDRAFQLQQASADRMAAEQQRSPVADHIAEQMASYNLAQQSEQQQQQDALSSLYGNSSFTDDQKRKAATAYMMRNPNLAAQFLNPKAESDPDAISKQVQYKAELSFRKDEFDQANSAYKKALTDTVGNQIHPERLKELHDDMMTKHDSWFGAIDKAAGKSETPPPTGTPSPTGTPPPETMKGVTGQPAGSPQGKIAGALPPTQRPQGAFKVTDGSPEGSRRTLNGVLFIAQSGWWVPMAPSGSSQVKNTAPLPVPTQPNAFSFPSAAPVMPQNPENVPFPQ